MPTESTPKATLTLKEVGRGFSGKNVVGGLVTTFRLRRGKANASLAVSDKTFTPIGDVKSMKDIVATVDYKLGSNITANTKYELGPKKYQVGATWDGSVANKVTQVKAWHTNKDNLVAGEATVSLNPKQKANVTFNQQKLLTAKYTLTKGTFTVEPSYNFPKSAPAVAVTKRVGKKADTLKLSYDIKSEGTALEYVHKPFKVTVATTLGKSLKIAKPTLSAVFEKTYNF